MGSPSRTGVGALYCELFPTGSTGGSLRPRHQAKTRRPTTTLSIGLSGSRGGTVSSRSLASIIPSLRDLLLLAKTAPAASLALKLRPPWGRQPPPGARTVRSLIACSCHRTGHDTGPTPSHASRRSPAEQLRVRGPPPPTRPADPPLLCRFSAIVVAAPFRPQTGLRKLRRTAPALACQPPCPARCRLRAQAYSLHRAVKPRPLPAAPRRSAPRKLLAELLPPSLRSASSPSEPPSCKGGASPRSPVRPPI